MDEDDDGWVANPFAALPPRVGGVKLAPAPVVPVPVPPQPQPPPLVSGAAVAPGRGVAGVRREEEQRIYPESGEIFTLKLLYEDFDGEYTPEEIYDFWETQCLPLDASTAAQLDGAVVAVAPVELDEAGRAPGGREAVVQEEEAAPRPVANSLQEPLPPKYREDEREALESQQEFFELGVGRAARAEEPLPSGGNPNDFYDDVRWRPDRQIDRVEAMRERFRTRVRARKDAARNQRLPRPLEMPGRRKVLAIGGGLGKGVPAQMPTSGLQPTAGGASSSSSSRGPQFGEPLAGPRGAAPPRTAAAWVPHSSLPSAAAPPSANSGGDGAGGAPTGSSAPGRLPRRRPFAAALAAAGVAPSGRAAGGVGAAAGSTVSATGGDASGAAPADPEERPAEAPAAEFEVADVVEVIWEPVSEERRHEALERLRKGLAELEDLEEDLRADRDVVLAAVRSDGFALRHAVQSLRADREVVLAAVYDSGLALQHAGRLVAGDREVVLAAVIESGAALEFASESLRGDHEVVLTALAGDPEMVRFATPELMDRREFVLAASRASPKTLQYASQRLRQDAELVISAVESHADALLHAAPELRGDYGVVYRAVSVNGSAIAYADAELRRDPKILAAAVQNDPLAAAAAEAR